MNAKNNTNIGSIYDSNLKQKHQLLSYDLENMDTLLLKTIVRSKIDKVTEVCYEFRKWIKTMNHQIQINLRNHMELNFLIQKTNNGIKTQTEWFNKFLTSIKEEKSSIIITWTNRQTDLYNNSIRKQILRNKQSINLNKMIF